MKAILEKVALVVKVASTVCRLSPRDRSGQTRRSQCRPNQGHRSVELGLSTTGWVSLLNKSSVPEVRIAGMFQSWRRRGESSRHLKSFFPCSLMKPPAGLAVVLPWILRGRATCTAWCRPCRSPARTPWSTKSAKTDDSDVCRKAQLERVLRWPRTSACRRWRHSRRYDRSPAVTPRRSTCRRWLVIPLTAVFGDRLSRRNLPPSEASSLFHIRRNPQPLPHVPSPPRQLPAQPPTGTPIQTISIHSHTLKSEDSDLLCSVLIPTRQTIPATLSGLCRQMTGIFIPHCGSAGGLLRHRGRQFTTAYRQITRLMNHRGYRHLQELASTPGALLQQ